MAKLNAQDRSLQGVDSKVSANGRVKILWAPAVGAQESQAIGKVGIVCCDRAGVAKRANVLCGKEAVARSQSARRAATNALCRVFDDRKVGFGKRGQATVEVDRHDGCGLWRNGGKGGLRVEVKALVFDVGKDRGGTEPGDNASGCKEGERACDHFVAGANA